MADTKKHGEGSLVPLLMRVALFAAFVPMGFNLVFETAVFDDDEARILTELGIGRPTEAANTALGPTSGVLPAVAFARLPGQEASADEKQEEQVEELIEAEAEQAAEAVTPPPAATPPPAEKAAEEGAAGIDHPFAAIDPEVSVPPVTAARVHKVTVALVERVGCKIEWKPHWAAMATGWLSLGGGVLVLVGLLSRLWAFFLAVIGGAVFVLESWGLVGHVFTLARDDLADFYQVIAQLSVFFMAIGVLFLGPGGISADRFLFGRRGEDIEEGIVSVDPT